ncbi:hypothetical protein ACFOPX_04325 [Helicobacter baculiformis]|uniref:Uncharacterized protein n=1 Tax=Helicobacter baculiformis TaxID=427351 RepID=A0ABV7ZJC2_9HELI|nr:hypothetical protein [Helicobacter baculiformis]
MVTKKGCESRAESYMREAEGHRRRGAPATPKPLEPASLLG